MIPISINYSHPEAQRGGNCQKWLMPPVRDTGFTGFKDVQDIDNEDVKLSNQC